MVITRQIADVIQPATSQVQPALALLAAPPAPPQQAAVATPVPVSALQPSTNAQGQRTFSGDPITLDFQGADLRAVLRTFADISGLNIVIDPSIQGTVDVALRDVPWDQALDIILRANKLGYSVDGTIVRIVPMNVLAQESDDRKKLADANALAGELRIITRPLSYAKAGDLVPIITKSSLSPRGDVQIDIRTNTLIIRDLADRLQAASELIMALDRPQPQVEIEARIITLNRNFAKELGLQWGFNGRVDPSVGTSTGLAFPNSAVLTGGTGAVNPAAPSALGLALGSINGALNLDVALRALETSGKVRIVSSPRVSTQNNIEAEITQGSQIPVQTVSNNTVTVTFIPAALVLRVTPQITASNTVIMRIVVDKSTVPVGTADRVRTEIAKALAARGVDHPFDVVSNPEFLKEGAAIADFMKPDRVVCGVESEHAGETMRALYEPFVRQGNPIFIMDVRSAEMVKYASNAMLACKISFINEMANLCEKYGADVNNVREGMCADKRIGNQFLYPGLGYGGSCFPKDTLAVVSMGKAVGFECELNASVHRVNQAQRGYFWSKIEGAFGGNLAGKRLAFWGVAFKPRTDDIREAPGIALMQRAIAAGATVTAFDPVALENLGKEMPAVVHAADMYAALEGADALVIATEWAEFRSPDWEWVAKLLPSKLIFDGRNLYRSQAMDQLGFSYYSVGRAPVRPR